MRRGDGADGVADPVERLTRLVVALGAVNGPATSRRVAELAAVATGAVRAELVKPPVPPPSAGSIVVPIVTAADPHGDDGRPTVAAHAGANIGETPGDDRDQRWAALRFVFERPPGGEEAQRFLAGVAACCGARLAEIRGRQVERDRREGDALLLGLANELLGTLDLDRLRRVVEAALVPVVADTCRLEADAPPLTGGAGPRSALAVPIRQDSTSIAFEMRAGRATLGRLWLDPPAAFTAEQRRVAQAAAGLTARALATAAGIADQAATMDILERSLLPEAFVPVPGLQLASRHVSASHGHAAGGDFYDAVRGHDGVTLIVGDVQGKGVSAATVTSLARHTLRAGALDDDEPGALLGRLNRALLYGQAEEAVAGRNPIPRFVTAAVVRLRPGPDGFDMVVARGGHPPPIVVRWDGAVETFEPRGVLLGVSADADFDEVRTCLRGADTLVLYTDGVTEHRRLAHPFDVQHLGMLVRNHLRVVDADAIAQVIEDTVMFVAPAEARDDMAVVVARVTVGRPG